MRTVSTIVFLVFTFTAITAAGEPAPADSASVAAFLELPKKEREQRREEAKDLRKRAEDERNGRTRLGLLQEAAQTDPSCVDHWLALADRQAAMGYEADAEASLAAARAGIDFLHGDGRREAARDYSLARAWHHYRRAEWDKGQDWASHALKAGAELDGHLVLQLNRSTVFRPREQFIEDTWAFVPRHSDWRRMGHYNWCNLLFHFFHYEEFDRPYVVRLLESRAPNRYVQEPLRWRDHGMYCEAHEVQDLALTFYRMSADAIEGAEGGWLHRRERTDPVLKREMGPMPFWVNDDGLYVTGSLLAYLGWLRDEMTAERDATRKDVLAERLLHYYDRTAERYELYPWPALWRAEAVLELDEPAKALAELRYARDVFRTLEVEDPMVDRVQGRALLVSKKFGRALQLLRPAVEAFPDDASCWADLGIAEAMAGDRTEARAAFDRALALDTGLAAAWYNRGLLSMKEGDLQSAQADLEHAVRLVPENDEIRSDLAKLVQKANAQRRGG